MTRTIIAIRPYRVLNSRAEPNALALEDALYLQQLYGGAVSWLDDLRAWVWRAPTGEDAG